MKVLAVVHKWPPLHNAGAEWMLHTMLRRLVERGHEVTVDLIDGHTAPYWLDGELVIGNSKTRDLPALARGVDLVVTHLDRTEEAARAARAARRPIVHVVHNERQLAFHHVKPGDGSLVVFNSEWIAKEVPWAGDSIICRPPIRTADYVLDRDPAEAELVTLVNATLEKGSGVVRKIAARQPDRRFLFVRGAYGVQDVRRLPRNIAVTGQTAAIARDIYARTRVLLMPSSYESYGRVSIEAAASGVPTIAHPTPGLLEALGPAGIFAPRSKPGAWVAELERLDDPAEYQAASARARARAAELEALTDVDLDRWEAALESLVAAHPAPYDDAVAILSSLRAGAKCPVCGASGCTCGAEHVAGGLRRSRPVGLFEPAAEPRGPMRVYRTYAGDIRLRDGAAEKRGLKSSGRELPRPVVRRFDYLDDDAFKDLAVRYASAGETERDAWLEAVAKAGPSVLAKRYDELLGLLPAADATIDAEDLLEDDESAVETVEVPDDPEPPAAGEPPTGGRMGELLEWAGTDPGRLARAIEAEKAAKNRPRLIAALEERLP